MLANPTRAAVTFEVDGQTYTLVVDWNALCVMESVLGIPTKEIAEAFDRPLSFTLCRAVMCAGLQKHHPGIGLEEAGRLLGLLGYGEALVLIRASSSAAFPTAEDAKATAGPRPAGGPKGAKARDGASPGASAPGAGSGSSPTASGS